MMSIGSFEKNERGVQDDLDNLNVFVIQAAVLNCFFFKLYEPTLNKKCEL